MSVHLYQRLEAQEDRVLRLESNVLEMASEVTETKVKVEVLDEKIDSMGEKLDKILDAVEKQNDRITVLEDTEARRVGFFKWAVGVATALVVAFILTKLGLK
jgi:chromosome segregation ATPase